MSEVDSNNSLGAGLFLVDHGGNYGTHELKPEIGDRQLRGECSRGSRRNFMPVFCPALTGGSISRGRDLPPFYERSGFTLDIARDIRMDQRPGGAFARHRKILVISGTTS